MQQFAVKIPINSDNFPIINFPVIPLYAYFVYPVSPIRTDLSHEHPLELGWIQPRKRRGTVTSQHILYYCTYYSVSLTCTVHCTIDIHTLYVPYMFPVSDVEVSSSTSVHHTCSHLYKFTLLVIHLVTFT